ncbi:MAG: NmrA/HSCARG family protein [Pseudomonadota bacterium]
MTSHRYSDKPVVVAGATGSQGGAVVRRLLERGHTVRALTRNRTQPAAIELASAGAEVIEADLMRPDTLIPALEGAGGVFSVQDFLEAGVDAEVEMGLNFTAAIGRSGIDHVVYSGASTMDRNTGVPHLDSKWRVEQAVRQLGLPFTILRPAAFMDNWGWEHEQIVNEGVVSMPLRPDTPYRQVAVCDIAAMAVIALEHPETWASRIVPLAGEISTPIEITATFSRVLGKPVRYEQMSWEDCITAQGEELTEMYRSFDVFGMDGDPIYLRRWHPGALTLEAFLLNNGWGQG